MPAGTVYGVLLNGQCEWQQWAAQMDQPPYLAPPAAPVLYIKTANTWSPHGRAIALAPDVPELEIGATVAMVIGPAQRLSGPPLSMQCVAGLVLLNDLCVPHASYFRPPVRYRCRDGLLGIAADLVGPAVVGDPDLLKLEVRVNGELRQSIDFSRMRRSAAQLLADVAGFMTLRPHDILMLGCDCPDGGSRPRARAGDRVEISAPGCAALGTLANTLVAQP